LQERQKSEKDLVALAVALRSAVSLLGCAVSALLETAGGAVSLRSAVTALLWEAAAGAIGIGPGVHETLWAALAFAFGEASALGLGSAGTGHVDGAALACPGILLDQEFNLFTIGKTLVAFHLDGREMNEIVVAINAADESESFFGIEKFDLAGHGRLSCVGRHYENLKLKLKLKLMN